MLKLPHNNKKFNGRLCYEVNLFSVDLKDLRHIYELVIIPEIIKSIA